MEQEPLSSSFEGLQLIIAILLMVLGVIIVISCGKELFRKKAGQETK